MPRRALLAAVLLCAALNAHAQQATDQIDPALYLPPPPAAGSPRGLAELAELKQIQAVATPEQVAAAANDDKHEDPTIFATVIGPGFDMAKLPATAALIRIVQDDEEEASGVAKKEFHRSRPWIVDPSIQTCTLHKAGPAASSYPSGHSTVAFARQMDAAKVELRRAHLAS